MPALPPKGSTDWHPWAQGVHDRAVGDLAAGTPSARSLGTGATQAAAGNHGHAAAGISDSTTVGQAVLTAPDQASARGAIGAGTSSLAASSVEGFVKWTGSAWPSRPSGFARVRWSSEGSTTATQPPGMVAGDLWEHPA